MSQITPLLFFFFAFLSVSSAILYQVEFQPKSVIMGQPLNVTVNLSSYAAFTLRNVRLYVSPNMNRYNKRLVFESNNCALHHPYTANAVIEGCPFSSFLSPTNTTFVIRFGAVSSYHIGNWFLEKDGRSPRRSTFFTNKILIPPLKVETLFFNSYTSVGRVATLRCEVTNRNVTQPVQFSWSRRRNSNANVTQSGQYFWSPRRNTATKNIFGLPKTYSVKNDSQLTRDERHRGDWFRGHIWYGKKFLSWKVTEEDKQNIDTYICTVTNQAGSAIGTSVLPELAYINVSEYQSIVNAKLGSSVSLMINVLHYHPNITTKATWKKLGRRYLVPTSGHTHRFKEFTETLDDFTLKFWLHIAAVEKPDYGVYQCHVQNEQVDVYYNYTLAPVKAPEMPTGVKVSCKQGFRSTGCVETAVSVEFKSGQSGANSQVFLLYLSQEGHLNWRVYTLTDPGLGKINILKLYGLSFSTGYNIRIQSKNDENLLSEYSDPIHFHLNSLTSFGQESGYPIH